MIKKIALCLLVGLVIMAALTTYTRRGQFLISESQLSSMFYISYTKHGVPLAYQETYQNNSGNYGPELPSNTGIRYHYLVIDYALWTLVAAIFVFTFARLTKKPESNEAVRPRRAPRSVSYKK